MKSDVTILYKHFDKEGRLLYVGVTKNLDRRNKEHKAASKWYNCVSRTVTEVFESEEEALSSEKATIRSEYPYWNTLHNDKAHIKFREQEARKDKAPSVVEGLEDFNKKLRDVIEEAKEVKIVGSPERSNIALEFSGVRGCLVDAVYTCTLRFYRSGVCLGMSRQEGQDKQYLSLNNPDNIRKELHKEYSDCGVLYDAMLDKLQEFEEQIAKIATWAALQSSLPVRLLHSR